MTRTRRAARATPHLLRPGLRQASSDLTTASTGKIGPATDPLHAAHTNRHPLFHALRRCRRRAAHRPCKTQTNVGPTMQTGSQSRQLWCKFVWTNDASAAANLANEHAEGVRPGRWGTWGIRQKAKEHLRTERGERRRGGGGGRKKKEEKRVGRARGRGSIAQPSVSQHAAAVRRSSELPSHDGPA